MSNSLSASIRRQIIEFDPGLPDSLSISQFCKELGISRPSYYKVKERFVAEGNKALNPHSRAPKTDRRIYSDQTKTTVLRIRKRLAKDGWDNGPLSIWFESLDTQEFGELRPSVATIGRILAEAGATKRNPRKRPRKSWLRFARSHPMEMWQIDGLEYRLFDQDATKAMIYQLIDDGSRFDVGTRCFEQMENAQDAMETLKAAFAEYGVPQQLLSDNGGAFNLSRQGLVNQTEIFLASVGCEAITGRFSHPQTQGKNERSHNTLTRFLDAHAPHNLAELSTLLEQYRNHYNHRRRHQALKVGHTYLTPAQAWEAGDHRGSDGVAIDIARIQAKAQSYLDKALAVKADLVPEGVVDDGLQVLGRTKVENYTGSPSVLTDQRDDVIQIRRTNPQIYFRGRVFKVPAHLIGEYQLVLSKDAYTLYSTVDGEQSLSFPLPVRLHSSARLVPLWQVYGARIRDPKPAWTQKRIEYEDIYYSSDVAVS
ncbi:IS481-like element ISAar22 family transposase [Glutamicibacter arilaitensis]|uniref:IS481-like element ISAar22 family transposase n=4 Tax=Glutamicibacter arilaitensis TaxID=256701 RepID=A0A2N7S6V1_9MICC|nr:IS481-like element ISAar22 family transposase [Glutamicibacter arilaitensis]PMQ18891.1 IS481-like element ISAar22 family transposase [Glutamicibacter arilaitensis]PMQ19195.1 IS481-like element ISAar22 family transposase [Glutamicibacter arilaitensis]PMQ21123.1 IS481-like element ISAar22 family transposase [Glutamicibacter arilaitensis]PMQ21229.1 IS481-like element ISAar22 family transposase [Glutamicibacter arilaitensis]PMQ21870.1 IS481-like element ISAar22 family transposase [Glutamicibact